MSFTRRYASVCIVVAMEMNFPHNRRRHGRPERSKDFALLVATVVARQLSAMRGTSATADNRHLFASESPLTDRIAFFGGAAQNAGGHGYGPFCPEEIFLSNDVNKCKHVVYHNDLTNGKSTGHKVDLPEEPAALRGMEV